MPYCAVTIKAMLSLLLHATAVTLHTNREFTVNQWGSFNANKKREQLVVI